VDIDPEGWQTELVMRTAKRTPGLAAGVVLLLQVSIFAEPITAGAYTGHWEGASGASGDFHLALTSEADGKWKAEISFGMNGQDVKCKVTALSVEGAKIHAVYTFDLQGIVLELSQQNENVLFGQSRNVLLTGSSLEGGRRTAADDPSRTRSAGGPEKSQEETDYAEAGSR
jgi:hypothetical protein